MKVGSLDSLEMTRGKRAKRAVERNLELLRSEAG